MPRKFTYEEVREVFESEGCVLLSDVYVSNTSPLDFICSCGNRGIVPLVYFREGRRCKICMSKIRSFWSKNNTYVLSKRRSLEDIRLMFEGEGCTLISTEYRNQKSRLEYICSCGNTSITSIDAFLKGHRCRKCGVEKQKSQVSGNKHYNWNPNKTEEERILKRDYKSYDEWRRAVFIRDNYTCVLCGKYGCELNAHHIYNYARYKEMRLDINNGVTLCDICHKEFHRVFGKSDNKRNQFEVFMSYINLPSKDENFSFKPDKIITRGEAAIILIKAIESLEEEIRVALTKV